MNATAADPRIVKQLTKCLYTQPDPVKWLLLADHYEEVGDDKEAAKWRKRAAWFPELMREVKELSEDKLILIGIESAGQVSIGGQFVHFRRKTKTIHFGVNTYFAPVVRGNLIKAGRGDQQYYTRWLLHIIDCLVSSEGDAG